ncbi:MAG TPA: hypothetical protein VHW03_05270 [Chthoniobacterales bacterium]|nr:hypothetical protein [Chthoniobacterales bacterium]
MRPSPDPLDRLFRAAAVAPNELAPTLPFGFETRAIAHWRSTLSADPVGLTRLLRRVIVMALALIVLAGAGAYRELNQGDDHGELSTNDYADAAIGGALEQ